MKMSRPMTALASALLGLWLACAPVQARAGEAQPVADKVFGATQDARHQLARYPQAALSALIENCLFGASSAMMRGDPAAARAALEPLAVYGQVEEFPSVRVQTVLLGIAKARQDDEGRKRHASRAAELTTIHFMSTHGGAEDIPLYARFEATEWMGVNGWKPPVRTSIEDDGKGKLRLVLQGKNAKGQDQRASFDLKYGPSSRYVRLDDAALMPQVRAALPEARSLREALLADPDKRFFKLEQAMREARREAGELLGRGKTAEALARMERVNEFHPADTIPSVPWLDTLVSLHSGLGNTERFRDTYRLMSALEQLMARQGEGRSRETAIEVCFVDEEYEWLRGQQLRAKRDGLVELDGRSYDVHTVDLADGRKGKIWFDVTRMVRARIGSMSNDNNTDKGS